MKLDYNSLEEKAGTTMNLLIKQVLEKVLSDVIKTYREEVIKPLNEVLCTEEAKNFEEEDFIRILFELLCFATFVIMVREAPKIITQRKLFHKIPDTEKVRYYNEKLLNYLDEYSDTRSNFTRTREIVMTEINPDDLELGLGEPLDAKCRVNQYNDALIRSGMDSAIQWFITKFAYAIDPKNFALIQPVAIIYAGNTIEYVESLVEFVFDSNHKS